MNIEAIEHKASIENEAATPLGYLEAAYSEASTTIHSMLSKLLYAKSVGDQQALEAAVETVIETYSAMKCATIQLSANNFAIFTEAERFWIDRIDEQLETCRNILFEV